MKIVGSVDFIIHSGYVNNLRVESLYVNSTSPTAGYFLHLTGGVAFLNNLYIRSVHVQGMMGFLHCENNGYLLGIVVGSVADCQFGYNNGNHILYDVGASAGMLTFDTVRFEPAGEGFAHIQDNSPQIGSHKFHNCVFESSRGAGSIYIGDNAFGWHFTGCHFENNCLPYPGVVDNGFDVRLGGGQTNVSFDSCLFSYPHSSTTNFYNIRNASSAYLTIKNSTIDGIGHAGYLGFCQEPYGARTGFIANVYNEPGGVPKVDYLAGMVAPVKFNDDQPSGLFGRSIASMVKAVVTTNATPTTIIGDIYVILRTSSINLIHAEVVGVNSAGTAFCSFNLRSTITVDSSNNAVIRGTDHGTSTASSTQAAAIALIGSSVGNTNGVTVTVTGLAGTTIRWVCSVTATTINH